VIVDAHAHAFGSRDWAPETFWQDYRRTVARRLNVTPEQVEAEILPALWDPDGAKLIAEMDACKIDLTVVVCLDYGLVGPETLPVERVIEEYAAFVRKHPDRLVFCTSIDARRSDAARLLRKSIDDLGARLLKLYPPSGFYPNDQDLVYPLYKICAERRIPVMLHIGPAPALSFRAKYSHPIHMDDVAADFPELPLILAHAGYGWWRDALALARSRPNLYLELSGWGLLSSTPQHILQPLREMLDVVPGRVIFGTDRIGLPGSTQRFMDVFRQAKEPQLTDGEIGDFLGGTAGHLLGV
jgi:predicted TIM-barrel fold metal-dependent hydrolase